MWWPDQLASLTILSRDTPTCGAGEDGQGGKLVRRFIGDLPGEAGAPALVNQVEAASGLGKAPAISRASDRRLSMR